MSKGTLTDGKSLFWQNLIDTYTLVGFEERLSGEGEREMEREKEREK